jgi:hypothetical protein
MTNEELDAIRERARRLSGDIVIDRDIERLTKSAREDVPKLLAEIARLNLANDTLRGNIKTIETLTECTDTKDFAKRALIGEATIRI